VNPVYGKTRVKSNFPDRETRNDIIYIETDPIAGRVESEFCIRQKLVLKLIYAIERRELTKIYRRAVESRWARWYI
jgi:hypothetical protein